MGGYKAKRNLCFLILIQMCTGIYIRLPSTENPSPVVKECPYECTCNFAESYSICENGFSISSLTVPTYMYQLKSLYVKRFEEILLNVRLDKFTNLEKLDLSSNVISEVPEDSFKSSLKLRSLSLRNNYIDSLKEHSFSTLKNLEQLDLSHNNIHELDPKLFQNLQNLLYLNLSKNAITGLQLDTFRTLTKLKVLDLSSNNIVHLTAEMFIGLNSLQSMNVSRNNLVSISHALLHLSDRFSEFFVTKNNFDCSCELDLLVKRIADNPLKYGNTDDLICNQTLKLIEFGKQGMSCALPEVTYVSNSSSYLARSSAELKCNSWGKPSSINYWKTPMGSVFASDSVILALRLFNVSAKSSSKYYGCDVGPGAKVNIQNDGTLYINSMRGFLAGKYTCVAVNAAGSTNATVDIGIYDSLTETKYMSLFIGAGCVFLALIVGIIIGSISLCVQKCSCCCSCCQCCSCAPIDEKDPEFKFTVEEIEDEDVPKHSTLESCNSNDSYSSYDPPNTPFNSPIDQTPRASPRKCPTPSVESSEKSKSPNIKDTLDEVKVRLEKKMEKVRGHYHSIKESGSVYLTNIKDTGNQAKIKVKASVVNGMEQVKYGVKSIKEFCGTGDMGTQTISALSFSPKEELKFTTTEEKSTTV